MGRAGWIGLALALAASPLAGQSVLTGTVRADSTGRPLVGVEVVIVGSQWRALTDGSGRYWLPMLPAGRRLALFRSVGFRPVQEWVVLGSADTVWANVMLIPQPSAWIRSW
ncbi:MAG TPA: carboxypeptidase-like regulatory domain-containing protein [Gemmatimonadales bacterium]|nr:carboxypeptidase-like regulatory domain-containing protein [Gemmatimonadales bacterium]